MTKRVAVIGAGCSGLTAIKCCLDEGLEPTCFERSSDIGGLWRFTEAVEDGRGSIYNSVITNTSKEMMCFSDFPMPEDFPVYLHHSKVLEYLHLYAEHFNLFKYIQFQTEVCSVRKCPDFATTGKWKVITESHGNKKEDLFDAILIGSGHFTDPNFPLECFPGIEDFKGRYIHSRFYKTPESYRRKTVLVVGIGNSAVDIAVEISHTAKQVFLSTRQGSWVISRISHKGFPVDMVISKRITIAIKNLLPHKLAAKMVEKIFGNWFNHAHYGLEPTNRLKTPILNDYLPSQILHGAIKVKPNVESFTENSAVFEDGTVAENLDEVIFATGYNSSFSFLDDVFIKLDENNVSLYKNLFPVHMERPTLAFLGLIQPLGPIMPTVELQTRWATRVFKGAAHLPSMKTMELHTVKSIQVKKKWFGKGRDFALQALYIDYVNEIAAEIGIGPSMISLFLTDPKLAWQHVAKDIHYASVELELLVIADDRLGLNGPDASMMRSMFLSIFQRDLVDLLIFLSCSLWMATHSASRTAVGMAVTRVEGVEAGSVDGPCTCCGSSSTVEVVVVVKAPGKPHEAVIASVTVTTGGNTNTFTSATTTSSTATYLMFQTLQNKDEHANTSSGSKFSLEESEDEEGSLLSSCLGVEVSLAQPLPKGKTNSVHSENTKKRTQARNEMAKRVAIIGAGCSGLTAIKCCLEEGLEPICFEKSCDIGGLWRFTEQVEEGRASLYSSVVTNTSKEMMCYTDFPMPQDFPAYLHNSKVLEYLRLYAEHFRLLKYIRFNTEVCSVKRRLDFSSTGQWDIVTRTNEGEKKSIFDAVLVCNGHHVKHYLPLDSFPGIEKFKGRYIHSRFYRQSTDYRGKTVLVVGAGNSAGDIAVEISNIAKQVYLSTRQGSWVISRIFQPHGYPLDMMLSTRCFYGINNTLPAGLSAKLNEKQMNSWFDHANYGLLPQDRTLLKEPIVNDLLPSSILHGAVRMKPGIKTFTETSVVFEDDTVVENLDHIIFATGYSISFPFLDDSTVTVDDNNVPLYKNVFPTHLEKPTLAFLGLIQPFGAILPAADLQARWATRIFKGVTRLPPVESMETYIKKKNEKKMKRFSKSRSQSLQSYFIEYMDEVSIEIDARPNVIRMLLTDPQLAWQLLFGPCTPYQYRLTGPGKWHGARKAILTQWDRTLNPSRTRIVSNSPESWANFSNPLVICIVFSAILLCLYYIITNVFL
ncbi:uncharacterized protein WCC33_009064 [Rhinophrynus dorsalis]